MEFLELVMFTVINDQVGLFLFLVVDSLQGDEDRGLPGLAGGDEGLDGLADRCVEQLIMYIRGRLDRWLALDRGRVTSIFKVDNGNLGHVVVYSIVSIL